ncbi:MAG: nucleotide exchange factor GrpE [Phycisphaerales bacterium]
MPRKRDQHDETDDQRDSASAVDAQEELADELAALRNDIAAAEDRYTRALADFPNSQRRALANESQARDEGASTVVKSVLPVLDHFDLALGQDPEKASAASILEGVKLIKGELLRTLAGHGVSVIEPTAGEELDHHRHEAVGQMSVEDLDAGRIATCLQAGYRVGDRVLRPAKVMVVAPGAETQDTDSAEAE